MRYFSLFTGIGGLDYGMEKRGFECVGFSEIKKSSIEIYGKHYPNHDNFGDITKIDYMDIPDFDILTGGFPCQSFSLAGLRKGLCDGKNKKGAMVLYIYKLLKQKNPKYFVLENVKGIINHDKGKTYRKIFRLFENAGYNVRVILLNALYYGSAQNRERVIFLGNKESFDKCELDIIDDTKRFKDVFDDNENGYKYVKETERNNKKIEQELVFNFELIGLYDRSGTLTTQFGCGEKLVYNKKNGKFRYLTPLECERLQGFPDGWTEGISDNARYWALGNAVNCNVSDYLFNTYLPKIWKI